MPRLNRQNIDRKTNKPNPPRVESLYQDRILDRSMQTRRDDDIIRSNQRTLYDIDYAIKWYIENEIQPQITANQELINVPVIFANGEKWDNVQRLGYLRDEKGMLQSPLIIIKRNSVQERDSHRKLDVNWPNADNQIIHRQRYNERNRYEDELFPIPLQAQQTRLETVKKMYSIKKVSFDNIVDIGNLNIFSTTTVPQQVLQQSGNVLSGGSIIVSGGGSSTTINASIMTYLINLTEYQATYSSATTVTVNAYAAINPNNFLVATKNEFDVYINGQYIDKAVYTWTPSDVATQTIVFNTALLGYGIDPTDTVIIKGRWQ
jgi:hypothetical protein